MSVATQTSSGILLDLINPDPAHILITDIASHLAMLCRFNGATRGFYSVAQHSVFVTRMVPIECQPYALLHDAHEAYLGDLTSPVKQALAEAGGKPALKKLVTTLDQAIHEAFGLKYPLPTEIARIVHHADMVALATEKRDLLAEAEWAIPLPSPAKQIIRPQSWPQALESFMREFERVLTISPAMTSAQEKYALHRAKQKATA